VSTVTDSEKINYGELEIDQWLSNELSDGVRALPLSSLSSPKPPMHA